MSTRMIKRSRRLPIQWRGETQYEVPIPKDESQRQAALERYDILDTAPEESFDTIVRLASHVCGTPVALMVLIDKGRQWFKARVGVRFGQTPRAFALCAHTIMQRHLFIISDLHRDKRFARNPFVVSGPKLRFYAGAPLVTPDNRAIGTICVMDKQRRTLSARQKADLMAMSRLIMTQLELRRALNEERRRKKT